MPSSTEMRAAVHVIVAAACDNEDAMVKRGLASQAFALAQQAQAKSWTEAEHRLAAQQME